MHEFSLSGIMATSKPEVVTTKCQYDIEKQFRRLNIGFRERQSQRNIERQQNMFSSAWILPIWKHGDHETGSSYNYASVWDRNTISASTYMFSRTPKSMEYRPTSSYVWMYVCMNSGRMTTSKPEVVITKCLCDKEMQFRRLDIGFRGRQSQRNIDRQQNMFSSAWILPIWKHGDHETGSSYN